MLRWKTGTETNNKGFEIQRSENRDQSAVGGSEWKIIGYVEGNGTTTESHLYNFIDNKVETGLYSYRLKQIDFDGSFEYSAIVDVEVNNIPLEFSLSQNYPNPFNPVTTIEYSIPDVISNRQQPERNLFVTLKVYDILGNEVSTLVNDEKPAGKYEVKFNGNILPSGIYFYRLTSGSYSAVKKLVLLK